MDVSGILLCLQGIDVLCCCSEAIRTCSACGIICCPSQLFADTLLCVEIGRAKLSSRDCISGTSD